MDLASQWITFIELLKAKNLDWALHKAPAQLRVAFLPEYPLGGDVGHLLPQDYQEFVKQFGYPMLGFTYYCSDGFSFLPQEYMRALSPGMPDRSGQVLSPSSSRTTSLHAFFACQDLAHAHGWSFCANDEGKIEVWRTEGGQPVEAVGSFSRWLTFELNRLTKYVNQLSANQIKELKDNYDAGGDPHRVIDYSLNQSFEVPAYNAEDLQIHWVEDQSGLPYAYGLIHDSGQWLIPMSKKFEKVRPFVNGKAEVVPYIPWSSGPKPPGKGEWRKINLQGEFVER